MITPDKLKEIESFNSSDFPILSVYLGSDTLQAPSKKFLTAQFHSLLHQYLDDKLREMFNYDIERIEAYINSYVPSARGLAIFSSGENLWQAVDFEFSLPAIVSVGSSPDLDPIKKAQQKYSKYLVLLVDREKARMFTVEQGEISEHSDVIGSYVPQRKSSTGRDGNAGRSDINERHTDVMLDRHIEGISKAVDKFVKAQDISFVLLGGHKEMFSRVAAALPRELRSKLVGSFVTEINIPLNDILLESKKYAAVV